MTKSSEISVFDPAIVGPAISSAFAKLDPRIEVRNPVMFVVEIVAILTTLIFLRDLVFGGSRLGFSFRSRSPRARISFVRISALISSVLRPVATSSPSPSASSAGPFPFPLPWPAGFPFARSSSFARFLASARLTPK